MVTTVLFRPGQQVGGFSFGLWLAIACLTILEYLLVFSLYTPGKPIRGSRSVPC
ncbi:hypothetical protein [Leptothermofonsia sp. ETS-13]|uniref:hypothetical protein n=1 Tax=Leptothermofonsia sp. ETS-13 TaxID=3035696 RepID=UPI003B9F3518